MTKAEITGILADREAAMENMSLADRIAASLHELDREEALGLADLMAEVATMSTRGDAKRALMFMLMGGLELGRELERRV